MTRMTSFLLIALSIAAAAVADDWPQIRGPNRDGISQETGLLPSWDENGPEELWRVDLGSGYAGIAVVGERVFTMDSQGEQEFVLCLDATSGRRPQRPMPRTPRQ